MWAGWRCDQRGAGLDRLASTVFLEAQKIIVARF